MKNRFYFTTAAFPNMITLLNLVAGFFSILMSVQEKYEYAVWLVLLALILDSLDGHVARIFGNETEFGRELDSLADAVSFVVAPCMLVTKVFLMNVSGMVLVVVSPPEAKVTKRMFVPVATFKSSRSRRFWVPSPDVPAISLPGFFLA